MSLLEGTYFANIHIQGGEWGVQTHSGQEKTNSSACGNVAKFMIKPDLLFTKSRLLRGKI